MGTALGGEHEAWACRGHLQQGSAASGAGRDNGAAARADNVEARGAAGRGGSRGQPDTTRENQHPVFAHVDGLGSCPCLVGSHGAAILEEDC